MVTFCIIHKGNRKVFLKHHHPPIHIRLLSLYQSDQGSILFAYIRFSGVHFSCAAGVIKSTFSGLKSISRIEVREKTTSQVHIKVFRIIPEL